VSANMYFPWRSDHSDPTTRQAVERLALAVAVKASEHYPKEKLNAALERINSSLPVQRSWTFQPSIYNACNQHFPCVWDIFADVIMLPRFNEAEVDAGAGETPRRNQQTRDESGPIPRRLGAQGILCEAHLIRSTWMARWKRSPPSLAQR